MDIVAYVITHEGSFSPQRDDDDTIGQSIEVHGEIGTLPAKAKRLIAEHNTVPTHSIGDVVYHDLQDGRRIWLNHEIIEWIAVWWEGIEWRLTDKNTRFPKNKPLPFWVGLKDGKIVALVAPTKRPNLDRLLADDNAMSMIALLKTRGYSPEAVKDAMEVLNRLAKGEKL